MDRPVLVIGGAVADLSVVGADPGIFTRHSTPVEAIRLSPGGDAMNEAAVLSRLGSRVSLLTLLGEDEMGEVLLRRCRDWGIDTAPTVRSADVPTSINLVLVDRDAQRRFVTVQGSSLRRLAPEHVLPAVERLTGEEIVSFASIFVSPCFGVQELEELFGRIKARGCTLCADMTRRKNGECAEDLAPALRYVDLLLANGEEAALLTGEKSPAAAAEHLHICGAKTVIVKLGDRGGCCAGPEGVSFFPAVPAQAIDTTGAGDTFAGALLHALSRGEPLGEGLRFAAAAASLCVERLGCGSEVLSREAALFRMHNAQCTIDVRRLSSGE